MLHYTEDLLCTITNNGLLSKVIHKDTYIYVFVLNLLPFAIFDT